MIESPFWAEMTKYKKFEFESGPKLKIVFMASMSGELVSNEKSVDQRNTKVS